MKKIGWFIVLLIIIFGIFGLHQTVVKAQEAGSAEHESLTLQVPLGAGKDILQYPYFPQYLEWLFEYFVGITAILAAIGLMWGGYKWIAASGNPGMITSAKGSIMNAAVGLVIALTSWLLLNTLNPRITNLEFPQIKSPGFLTESLSCSGKDFPLTGDDGTCLPPDQIPPLALCRVAGQDPVYGDVAYVAEPWGTNCGESASGNACQPAGVADDDENFNQMGTACADGSKQACFIINKDYSQSAYFRCMDSLSLPEANAKGFNDSAWTGGDGPELCISDFRLKCGKIYWEEGNSSGDGFFGTFSYRRRLKDRSACVIDLNSYTIYRSKSDCLGNWFGCGAYAFCEIGCFDNAWVVDHRGTVTQAGCPTGVGHAGNLCDDLSQLADTYNVPHPSQNAPVLDQLISCVTSNVAPGMIDMSKLFTVDRDHPTCNYTRGHALCEPCSHTTNSCHYGGSSGNEGALAVDFNAAAGTTEEDLFDAIEGLVVAPGACAGFAGEYYFEDDHTHVAAGGCG
ncbi:MAG: pilin [Patescibacteria group bacterium]